MYLHHILTRDSNSLIARVFWAQVHDTTDGDWCEVVREDLDMLGLSNMSFDDVKNTNKEALKVLVNNRISITALQELELEKLTLSKVSNLTYDALEIQPYLTDTSLPVRIKQLIFRWRTRMVRVGWNYGKKETCPICSGAEDTQSHLLECNQLNAENHNNIDDDSGNCESGTYNLSQHMARLETAIRRREVILNAREKEKQKTVQ